MTGRTWTAAYVVLGLTLLPVGGAAANQQTPQTTPKPAATQKAKPQSQTSTKLRAEGTVVRVGQDWFDIEILRTVKESTDIAVGSRVRILHGQARIWRDGAYLRGGLVRVGEKVQVAAKLSQTGSPPTYVAQIIKVVQ